jgi:arylsulfatase
VQDRPNIILITTDQHRGDCLGIDGHPVVQTPNLDALAASGIRFRRGMTESPSCIPARRCLMTGMAPAAQGMVGMTSADWNPPHTLAGSLRDAGYQTALIGKLHLAPKGKRFGFEIQELADGPYEYEGNAYTRWLRDEHGIKDVDAGIAHGVDVNGWIGRPGHLTEQQGMTYWCTSRAIDFLHYQRDPTAPFFLNVSIFDPHPPLVPPEWYYNRYIQREFPEPVIGDWAHDPGGPAAGYPTAAWRVNLSPEQMRCCRAAYYATVNYIDDQIGRLVQYLRREKLYNNTLILFTSDHGEMLGDHHLFRKCWPYEGSARVPYLLKPPDSWGAQARISDCPVGLQDVMPTLLDAADTSIPDDCTGRSLLPIVRAESGSVREALHIEDSGTYEAIDGYHALISERHKYIWYSQRGTEHLFDLETDPDELTDLALSDRADRLLTPWREKLAGVLANRPEGFVDAGRLTVGKPHTKWVPGYPADRFVPFL